MTRTQTPSSKPRTRKASAATPAPVATVVPNTQPRRRGLVRGTFHVAWTLTRWSLIAIGILCAVVFVTTIAIAMPSQRKNVARNIGKVFNHMAGVQSITTVSN